MHNQNEIRNGIYERKYENGQLRIQEPYRNGKREGISRAWYSNGQVIEYQVFRDGTREGEYKIWYPNGQICTQNFYRHGRLEGSSKWWNEDGKLKEAKFYRSGILEGEFRYWDGGTDSHFYFKNGELIYNLKKSGFLAVKRFLRIRRSLPDFNHYLIPDLSRMITGSRI